VTDASSRSAPQLRLRLYLAGDAPNSLAAHANLRAALADLPEGDVHLEIIDVLQHPERGLQDGVLMTPMFVRLAPEPERRILGNLSARAALLGVLGLDPGTG
jgi:circadian clock protein KaiB